METLENQDLSKQNVEIPKEKNKDLLRLNKCSLRNYVSSYKNNLKAHVKTHGVEKSNKCNLCDHASSRADSLRKHLKTHSGEKSNKCNLCDFTCTDPSSLRAHMKRHTGEKLKGKLGDFFLFVQSFYRPKTKTSFNRQFSPKRPKLVKNQAKGSEIHQIRTKWHPSYCGNPSILSSI